VAEVRPHLAIATLVRLVLNFRIIVLFVTVLALIWTRLSAPVLVSIILALALGNLLFLLRWDVAAPFLIRHPVLLGVDCLATAATIMATGPEGPFVPYSLGTAFLAGVVYGRTGALIFGTLLSGCYLLMLQMWSSLAPGAIGASFLTAVGLPVLYPLLALGAVSVRDLLIRQASTEARLAAAVREAAISGERSRLAREMHDSLGKTLNGISLLAASLPAWLERDRRKASIKAQALSRAAAVAAAEARELMTDLRSDRLDLPLHQALASFVDTWSGAASVTVHADLRPVSGLSPGGRYELFCIAKEALRNVERHAAAGTVLVRLDRRGEEVELRVEDDGVGIPRDHDLAALSAAGRFGLVGMRERAERVGGRLAIAPRAPSGTVVTATLPTGDEVPLEERTLAAAP